MPEREKILKTLNALRDFTITSAIVIAGICGFLWVFHYVFAMLGFVLWPVIAAGLLSLLVEPGVSFLQEAFGGNRRLAVNTFFLLLGIVLLGGIVFIIPILWQQIKALIDFMPQFTAEISDLLTSHWPAGARPISEIFTWNHNWHDIFGSLWDSIQPTALNALKLAGTTLTGIGIVVVAWAILPIYLFYFLMAVSPNREPWHRHLSFLPPAWRNSIVFLVEQFVDILINFFRGQFLIAGIMAIFLSIGLTLIGLKFGFLIGLIMGLLNVIPYVGSLIGWIIALPLAYFQPNGGWNELAWVVGVLIIGGILESYILAPKIMGKRTGLHPAVILFSLFFWSALIPGPLGLLLAIPLSAFWVVIWRLVFTKISHEEVK